MCDKGICTARALDLRPLPQANVVHFLICLPGFCERRCPDCGDLEMCRGVKIEKYALRRRGTPLGPWIPKIGNFQTPRDEVDCVNP